MNNTFKLANKIEVRSAYSNIDALYGPYTIVSSPEPSDPY